MFPIWARSQLIAKLAEPPANKQWPQKLRIKACEGCNRGLGKDFEEPASEILKRALVAGNQQTLNLAEMRVVAGWAYLKDIEQVLGRPQIWTRDGPEPHTARNTARWRSELATLRKTRHPPDGYVARCAVIGSATNLVPYRSFTPEGWRHGTHAWFTGLFEVGRLVIESVLTSPENAAKFVQLTRDDARAVVLWPLPKSSVAVGASTVPMNHAQQWKAEHAFHPESGWGGGWRIRVPHGS